VPRPRPAKWAKGENSLTVVQGEFVYGDLAHRYCVHAPRVVKGCHAPRLSAVTPSWIIGIRAAPVTVGAAYLFLNRLELDGLLPESLARVVCR
jgi:hypothetical protein